MDTRVALLQQVGHTRPYHASMPLTVTSVALDPPGPGEVLVRIAAAGVCHSDLSVIDGTRPRPVPMALGHEAAGTVEALGTGVEDVPLGSSVVLVFLPSCGRCADCQSGRPYLCPPGATANAEGRLLRGGRRLHLGAQDIHSHLGVAAFADYVVVDRGSLVVIPTGTPLEIAALFGCAVLTGTGAVLNTAGVKPGQSVAVFGLGGVGLAAVLGAVVAGAYPIVAVDPIEAKRVVALKYGATLAVAPADVADALAEVVGAGTDFAFEAAGDVAVLRAAYAHTARGGTTVSVGLPPPAHELGISAASLVSDAKTLIGSYMGSAAPQRDIPRYLRLWQAGRLPVDALHTGSLPLEEINVAMEALASGSVVRQLIVP